MKQRVVITALLLCQLYISPAFAALIQQPQTCNVGDFSPVLTSATRNLKPNVVKLALTAYNSAVIKGLPKQPTLTIIDFSLPSSERRLWVIDLAHKHIIYNTYVAHGQGSGDILARRFSDLPETHESSLGLFLTGQTYFGHEGYSLKLYGLEKGINDRAASRDIVVHGASYVGAGRFGRSWGCPAVPAALARPIIDMIKHGTLLFAYYPDRTWLRVSRFLHYKVQHSLQTQSSVIPVQAGLKKVVIPAQDITVRGLPDVWGK